jgi:hypothetical protein
MATETKPSSEPAPPPPQFQVDEAYEYRAPKYFDFVADGTDDQVRAAERWFEAGASHAPSRTQPPPPYRFVPLPSVFPAPIRGIYPDFIPSPAVRSVRPEDQGVQSGGQDRRTLRLRRRRGPAGPVSQGTKKGNIRLLRFCPNLDRFVPCSSPIILLVSVAVEGSDRGGRGQQHLSRRER